MNSAADHPPKTASRYLGMRSPGRVGRAIRDARTTASLTQAATAEAAGISREALSHLENGNRNARIETLNSVLNVLGYEIAFLPRSERAKRFLDRAGGEREA